jgi:hypothetical protein
MNIIRVFPCRTSYTPDDDMVFIGEPPPLLIPPHDEVHISCVFTWDKDYCEQLKFNGKRGRTSLFWSAALHTEARQAVLHRGCI